MQLGGIHHLTAVTAEAGRNREFYTGTLGLRLVKKTVNQDDVSAYHLFYADGAASPGTDITFFEWPIPRERRGTHSISRTGFRVAREASVAWWERRFSELNVAHEAAAVRDGRLTLDFEDFEGQRLSLVVDNAPHEPARPWLKSPVPSEHQLLGLGPITLSVPTLDPTARVLLDVLGMRRERSYQHAGATVEVFAMGPGGPAAELHVRVDRDAPTVQPGAGGVHHVAFRTTSAEYDAWAERLDTVGVRSSGPVNRYYFRSLYFREPNGILFEIATDEPGFAVDESMETLGDRLALPPFLEPRRAAIEAGLKPV